MAQGKARFNSLGIAAFACAGNSYAINADETAAYSPSRPRATPVLHVLLTFQNVYGEQYITFECLERRTSTMLKKIMVAMDESGGQ